MKVCFANFYLPLQKATFNVSLANLLPAGPEDPDKDIKILEDALANAEHMTLDDGGSFYLMAHSHEKIIAVHELDEDGVHFLGEDVEDYMLHEGSGAAAIVDGSTISEGDESERRHKDSQMRSSEDDQPASARSGFEAAARPTHAAGTASVLMGKRMTMPSGSIQMEIMGEGERHASVSFCPTVSVVEFEKRKEFEEARMKGLLGSLLKLKMHKTAEKDAQGE